MDKHTILEFVENNIKSLKESATRTVEHAAIASAQAATVAQALRNMEAQMEQIKASIDAEGKVKPLIPTAPPNNEDE